MHHPWETIDAFLKAQGIRVGPPTLSQTTGGKHVPTSFHYLGRARDYGAGSGSDPEKIARALEPFAKGEGAPVIELFYQPTGTFYKHGKAFIPSKKLADDHRDHVHASLGSGIDMRKVVKIGGGVAGLVVLFFMGVLLTRRLMS